MRVSHKLSMDEDTWMWTCFGYFCKFVSCKTLSKKLMNGKVKMHEVNGNYLMRW